MFFKLKRFQWHILICILFFIAYTTLSLVRHFHYESYGFDLGIADQIVWKYSRFQVPITTVQHFNYTSILSDHIEFIYILLSPLYWIFSSPVTLLVVQSFLIALSGIPLYRLFQKAKITPFLSHALLISYLLFFGIQNAIWFDVHSLTLAAGILPWFLYYLDQKNNKKTFLFFFLSIMCKEDIALFTLVISFIYFVKTKRKITLLFMGLSILYLFMIFFVYFPHFTRDGYRYQSTNGLLSNIQISNFANTPDKQKIIFFSLAWFGMLPLAAPFYLLPWFTDLFHYFVIGWNVSAAQHFFMHYRVLLSLFLIWPTLICIQRFHKYLNNRYVGFYLLFCAMFFQYFLHLPISYLSKSWFWKEPTVVKDVNKLIKEIPKNASIVSQNNITPHLSQRNHILTLWPDTKPFPEKSPCGKPICEWFRWAGKPEYLVIAISPEWDIRHYLLQREPYLASIHNLERAGFIKEYKREHKAVLYKINPAFYKI